LRHIEIPYFVNVVGTRAFGSCDSLHTVVWNSKNANLSHSTNSYDNRPFEDCNKLRKFVFGDSVVTISNYALYGMENIDTLVLNNGLEYIGSYAFYNCDSLKYVEIPYSVKTVGNYAFQNCRGLNTVLWNSPTASLNHYTNGNQPFNGCNNLRTLVFGNSIRCIPNYALRNISTLETIKIGNNVDTIGSRAFYYCKVLKEITFEGDIPADARSEVIKCL
jgi:hypothetical protein